MKKREREGKKLLFNTVDEQMEFWLSGKGIPREDPELINIFGVIGDESIT